MKHHLYLTEVPEDASSYQVWDCVRRAPGITESNGCRIILPQLDVKALGNPDEWYGAQLMMKLAVQRDIMHTVMKRRGTDELQTDELQKIGEIADKFVEEHPEMWAIRAQYTDKLTEAGIEVP